MMARVDEDGRRSDVGDRRGRGDPGDVGNDDFITFANTQRHQAQVQAGCAGRKAQGEASTDVLRESLFEAGDVPAGILIPVIGGSIGDIGDFFLGNPRAGHWDSLMRLHETLSSG
jgi:hypothetical protein